MKLTKAILREHGIVNPWIFCNRGGGKVFISYSPQITGRAYQSARWQVISPGRKTDPDGHYRDNGHKTFSVNSFAGKGTHSKIKEQQRLAAIAWATEKYGIDDWVRDPFGDFQQREVWERVVEKIRGQAAAKSA